MKAKIYWYILGVAAMLLLGVAVNMSGGLPDYLKSAVFSGDRVEGVVSGSSLAQGHIGVTVLR